MCKTDRDASVLQPGQGKRGEDGYLGYLLRQAASAYRNRMEQALTDLDLTPPQFSVMTMLAAYPGRSNADLARLALLTPQTMSVIVANLAKAGLVQRKPHDVHGRIQQIELTDRAVALLARAKRRVYALERELREGLPEDAEHAIRGWLVAIAAGSAGSLD
jgi:DNA-binding MarR family transcriptional regulator